MEDNSGILLIPKNCEKTKYRGFIEASGVEYYLEMEFLKPFENLRMKCEWKLKQKLKVHVDDLKAKAESVSSPVEFALELQKLLKDISVTREEVIPILFCSTLVKHIEDLGWDKVKDVNKDFTDITMQATDSTGREHLLIAHPCLNFPKNCPNITTELPIPFAPQWGGIFSSLKNLYRQFVELLPIYQRFWDEIDELHAKCWILEPEKPSFAAKDYRIALGSSSSLLIMIDPLHLENPPECRFMGAEAAILPVRERFLNNIQDWNETLSIYQNLKNILRIDFPLKQQEHADNVNLQCGICYAYKLGNEIPQQACNEQRCGQLFHRSCLVEWIQSVPGAKQSFQTLFGECPYCNSAITVKLDSR